MARLATARMDTPPLLDAFKRIEHELGVRNSSIDSRYPKSYTFSDNGKYVTKSYRTKDGRTVTMHGTAVTPLIDGAPALYRYDI